MTHPRFYYFCPCLFHLLSHLEKLCLLQKKASLNNFCKCIFNLEALEYEREVTVSETYTRERTWVYKAKSEAQCGNFNI